MKERFSQAAVFFDITKYMVELEWKMMWMFDKKVMKKVFQESLALLKTGYIFQWVTSR